MPMPIGVSGSAFGVNEYDTCNIRSDKRYVTANGTIYKELMEGRIQKVSKIDLAYCKYFTCRLTQRASALERCKRSVGVHVSCTA